jgi:hypothetical protein
VPRLFALDQNFPTPIVNVLSDYQTDAELVGLATIDSRLAELDDWEVLLALHHHERPWDGLITTDTSMLNQPRELCALAETNLTLVVVTQAGHNPVKASGLLLAYLERVSKLTQADRPQIWRLAAGNRPPVDAATALQSVADHRNTDTETLLAEHRLTTEELARDPLAPVELG